MCRGRREIVDFYECSTGGTAGLAVCGLPQIALMQLALELSGWILLLVLVYNQHGSRVI